MQIENNSIKPVFFKCSLDPVKFTAKPPKEPKDIIIGICSRLADKKNQVVKDLAGLGEAIKAGQTWSSCFDGKGQKTKANFKSSQVIGLDFDNEIDKLKLDKSDPRYLSLESCLKLFSDAGIIVNAFYYSFSSTIECEKYRLIILLSEPINTVESFENLLIALMRFFPQIDKSCKNADRLFFGSNTFILLSNQPNAYEAILKTCPAELVNVPPKVKTPSKQYSEYASNDVLKEVAETIPYFTNKINNIEVWNRIGFACASLGEDGRQPFIEISLNQSSYPKDTPESLNRDFDRFLKRYDGQIKIATLFQYAKENGYKKKEAGQTSSKMDNSAVEQIKDSENLPEYQDNSLDVAKSTRLEKRAAVMTKIENFLKYHTVFYDKLSKNYFTGFGTQKIKLLDDKSVNTLWIKAVKNKIDIASKDFKLVLNSDATPSIDPLNTYFKNLETWDGKENIKALAETVKLADSTENDHFYKMLIKWLVGAVAGAVSDNVNGLALLFLGKQGKGKSTWFRNLLPAELSQYYCEHSPKNDKDSLMTICANFIVNIDELSAFHKNDVEYLKGLLTQKMHDIRLPYGTVNTKIKRQSSFCGSGNPQAILSDLTGNRRFLIFDVDEVDYTSAINMNQVWAEALHKFKAGFRYWLNAEEIEMINEKNENFMMPSLEEEMILKNYSVPEDGYTPQILTASEIALNCGLLTNQTSLNKISEVLRKHGFKRDMIAFRNISGKKSTKKGWFVWRENQII